MFDFPNSPTVGQVYAPTTGLQYTWDGSAWRGSTGDWMQSLAADMSLGFRTSGNRFVVNDKADFTGNDVFAVDETGAVRAYSVLQAAPVSGNAVIALNKPASATAARIQSQTAGSTRWAMDLGDGVAESGSNAGSNFSIFR